MYYRFLHQPQLNSTQPPPPHNPSRRQNPTAESEAAGHHKGPATLHRRFHARTSWWKDPHVSGASAWIDLSAPLSCWPPVLTSVQRTTPSCPTVAIRLGLCGWNTMPAAAPPCCNVTPRDTSVHVVKLFGCFGMRSAGGRCKGGRGQGMGMECAYIVRGTDQNFELVCHTQLVEMNGGQGCFARVVVVVVRGGGTVHGQSVAFPINSRRQASHRIGRASYPSNIAADTGRCISLPVVRIGRAHGAFCLCGHHGAAPQQVGRFREAKKTIVRAKPEGHDAKKRVTARKHARNTELR